MITAELGYNQLSKCTRDTLAPEYVAQIFQGDLSMKIIAYMGSGIYTITNKDNLKIYVGSAVSLYARSIHHINALKRGTHGSHHLQRAFNLYGADCFHFTVLEYCEKDKLIEREQFYIDTLHPEYNISPTAGSQLGIKRSEETKKKMSIAQKGKVITTEQRKKISAGLMGIKQSAETKQKRAISLQKRVVQYTKDGAFVKVFQSLLDAAKITGASNTHIIGCCKQKINNRTAGGYQWRYADDGFADKLEPIGIYYKPTRRIHVSQFMKDGIYINTYDGIENAEKITGIGHIADCCANKRKFAGGYIWRYAS